jgi:imidazolonepropionase-like amidohydrolase
LLAIRGGKILTITKGVIEEGTVLIDDGKIVDVGADLEVPKDADIRILDGGPLKLQTKVEMVLIEGEIVYKA